MVGTVGHPQRIGPLRTERLELRLVGRADAAELQRMFRDPRVNRYLPPARRLGTGRAFVVLSQRGRRAGTAYRFVARTRATGEFVASVSLFDVHREDGWAELGYALPRRQWGKGYATEAVVALLEWGFDTLHLHRVAAWVVEPNRASVAVLRRLGFRAEGRAREAALRRVGYDDLLHFGVLEPEFARRIAARRARRRGHRARPVRRP